ncbi:dermonecrotic toxin domain-containing protein [Pseudomonas fluorescens]|uniref:dermonecrotic toxin domain-containing protein n=1 Tax=Pseudomonas fluorescens TaxID=294 RepID=UPI0009369B85|nr:DUF6543 domain-containing protein [Pseudomonas fluorescens]
MHVNSALLSQPSYAPHSPGTVLNRQRRALDQSPAEDQFLVENVRRAPSNSGGDGYERVSVNPDPGKTVGNLDKTIVPVDIGINIDSTTYTETLTSDFKSVTQDAAQIVKRLFKDKWNLDIDPDKTYLTTFDYNTTDKPPYPAKLVKEITLTQAMVKNAQETPKGRGALVPHYTGGPQVKLVANLPHVVPGVLDVGDRINPGRESAHITHTYQGIYKASAPGTPQVYDASTQLSVSPEAFKAQIWDTDFHRPYTEFLNTFWDSHDRKYPIVAKAALVKAAHSQHQEGSLTLADKQLVMRAAGLPSNTQAWADTLLTDLIRPTLPDQGLEVGLLKMGRYESTDLMVITEKTTRRSADGKPINRTLLVIPGNSSPIHGFDSVEQMKQWFAQQAADPVKRTALEGHFKFDDLKGSVWHAGVREALEGLGSWPKPGHRYKWDPSPTMAIQSFNATGRPDPERSIDTNADVFHQIGERQRLRSYADARAQITTDLDVTKVNILSGLSKAAMVATLFAPLAIAIPEVALAMDALFIASGIVEAGIGADDLAKDRPGGVEHLIFGVLNAVQPVATRTFSQARAVTEEGAMSSMARPVETTASDEAFEKNPINLDIDNDFTSQAPVSTEPAPVTETLSEDGELITLTGTKDNLNKVEDNLYTFADMNKRGTQHRLNIIAHGDGTHVYYKGRRHTPQGLLDTLKRNGIFPTHYDNIRILSCYSGKLGENSFAAQFQRLTERPVKGYTGEVTARYSAEHILGEPEAVYNSGENPVAADHNVTNDDTMDKEFKPEKTNPYSVFQNPFKWWRFSYKPVTFTPSTNL